MNIFAGNFVLEWNKVISDLDFDYIETLGKSWDKLVFIFGETELNTSKKIVDMLEEKIWKIKSIDISIETEDKIEIMNETYEEWIYELATFEWEQVDYDEIVDRFWDFEEVVSIREAEKSERFWNKVVKVDFVY